MDTLVMCGGRGTRLDVSVERPLVDICGRSMPDRAVAALRDPSAETARAVTLLHTPSAHDHAADLSLNPIETSGDSCVSDFRFALAHVFRPVVTVVSDLPFMAPEYVGVAVSVADGGVATARVPVELRRDLGASVDDTLVFDHEGIVVRPTGLGVVGPAVADATIDIDIDTDTHLTMYLSTDIRLALGVNRPTDIGLAEDRCK